MIIYVCPECNLIDPYNGDGDGIGSCDCSRCDGCGEVSVFCDCDDYWDDRDGIDG